MSSQSIRIMEQALGEALQFIHDSDITNIEVNSHDGAVWIDGVGGRRKSKIRLSENSRKTFLSAAASFAGKEIHKDEPSISVALPEQLASCRLEGSLPPLTKAGSMVIRKPSARIFPIDSYATPKQIKLIKSAIADKKNILIAGSTDSGKTSLLKSILTLYKEVCPGDRVITIEDNEELVPVLDNTESLFSANHLKDEEGQPLGMEWIVRKTLRSNPDRLVVGEVRGREARAVLHGWDTGHEGGVCTFHAGGAKQGFYRFFDLAGLDEDKTAHVRLAAGNVDYVLYVNKNDSGKRTIEEIIAVSYDYEAKKEVFSTIT